MESVKKQEPFQLTLSKKEEKLRRRKKIFICDDSAGSPLFLDF